MQKYKMPIGRLRMMVCLIGMLLPMCMFAQQITVQGVVKDQTGETVIGASVMEKGTTNGTITGIDGDFSLNMSPNGTLVVSFVGYKTQEVQVKGQKQKQLQVVLSEDAEMLDEVVVIGYGTMKKSDLTGAVSSIGNKDIKDSPVSNLGQAIQGKISGVQIVDAGKPGDNVSIKIRGLGSINNCDPLVVIDGVPTDLGLSSLNMADVERFRPGGRSGEGGPSNRRRDSPSGGGWSSCGSLATMSSGVNWWLRTMVRPPRVNDSS